MVEIGKTSRKMSSLLSKNANLLPAMGLLLIHNYKVIRRSSTSPSCTVYMVVPCLLCSSGVELRVYVATLEFMNITKLCQNPLHFQEFPGKLPNWYHLQTTKYVARMFNFLLRFARRRAHVRTYRALRC